MEANDMSNPNKEKAPIVVHTTPEMANWMHPQTKERKHLMLARAEAARQRSRKRLEAARQRSRRQKRIAVIIGQSQTVVEPIKIVVKTTHSIPRQKVLGYLNQTNDELLHRVDK
jgi:hypothetical protein